MLRSVPIIPGCLIVFLIASDRVCPSPPEARPTGRVPDIDAQCWFNPQPVRLYEPPRLLLLEFWSVRSRESRRFAAMLNTLHEFFADKGLLVVGLSPDECKDTEYFLRHERIDYKVGGESETPKAYRSNEFPDIVLIDLEGPRIVGRWSGGEVKAEVIARAIAEFLGPPRGAFPVGGDSHVQEQQVYLEHAGALGQSLRGITSAILDQDGEVSAEAISVLDSFYEANLPDDPDENNAVTRARRVARSELLGSDEMGYGKLFAGGRLSDEAKSAIQDRALQIAQADPSGGVRMSAVFALGRYIGKEGDASLLNPLRRMLDREEDPFVRAAIDQALDRLDPAQANRREDLAARPIALSLRRMLKESPDPASSQWADAYAYQQSVRQQTTEQLFEDYWSFPDPPDDEVGRQNATLKRQVAMDEIDDRIRQGAIGDLRHVKDHMARALSQEPDPFIRKYMVWSGLRIIAKNADGKLRAEIVDLLEQRLPVEPHRHVRAPLEAAIKELKGE